MKSAAWLSSRRSALNAGELEFLRESLELDKKETSEARPERARMRKISMTFSLVGLAIYYPFVILQAWPRVNQSGSGVFSILISTLLFAFIALTTSYFFADWMTRLDSATRGLPLRLLAMGALGGLAGAPLFMGVSGQFILWYAGLLLGLALAVFPLVPAGRKIPALALAGLTAGLALVTLAGVPEIFWPQKLASALAAGCFCGVLSVFCDRLRGRGQSAQVRTRLELRPGSPGRLSSYSLRRQPRPEEAPAPVWAPGV